jgi:hypothetical protein
MMVRVSVSGSNGMQDAALWSCSFCEDKLRGLRIVDSGVGKEAKVKFVAAL